jgi:hypothetical protein
VIRSSDSGVDSGLADVIGDSLNELKVLAAGATTIAMPVGRSHLHQP